MPRPCRRRRIACLPPVAYYKPQGVPLRTLQEVALGLDELEALRLADVEGLSHEDAGRQMGVSRATFGRIVQQARRKTAQALTQGMALRIEGGSIQMAHATDGRLFVCADCGYQWGEPLGTGPVPACPKCDSPSVVRAGGGAPGGGRGMGRGGRGCGRGGGRGRGMGGGQGMGCGRGAQ